MKFELAPIRKDSTELYRIDKQNNYVFNLRIVGDENFVIYINECKLVDKNGKQFVTFPNRSYQGNDGNWNTFNYVFMPKEASELKSKIEQLAISTILNKTTEQPTNILENKPDEEFDNVEFIFE